MAILILIFVVVLVFSFTVVALTTRPRLSEKTVEVRLSTIRKTLIDRDADHVKLAEAGKQGFAARVSARLKDYHFSVNLELLILHAGSKSTVGSIVLTSIGLAIAFAFASHLFLGPLPLVLLTTVIGGTSRYASLRFQKSRRLNKFNTALPDAIELMARALRAGHSMGSSIEIIAEQSVEPLAAEFGTCFQQQKFGIPFRDALLEMGGRVPSKDLHFLITAVLVQKETGGDLTDILDRTTRVIRDRVRIEGEVRTYTAQGRLTGWILGLLPVIMLALINIVSPGYSHILFYDPLGQKLLYAGGTLIIIGGLIIRKIVNIKV
jgi:tight adherence protein B